MRALLNLAATVGALSISACGRDGGAPLLSTVFVPSGNFRAQTLCGEWFERACKLSYEPPIGKSRHRVLMWLDAFWADADLVTRADYEACRAAGACQAPQEPLDPRSRLELLADVPFDGAVAYCHWRGWRLPTPDEYERMARWTDGRPTAAGVPYRSNERRPSPEGLRSLNLTEQWVATENHPVLMGGAGSTHYRDVKSVSFTAPFRCVRSAFPSTDPGRAIVAGDQSDPWLRGGPD